MRALVIGASGFLGRHVKAALHAHGHLVLGTSRKGGNGLVAHELGGPFPVEVCKFNPDVVLNLAWEGIPDFTLERCRRNVELQMELVESVIGLDSVRRLVMAGSCREYGDAASTDRLQPAPLDEFGRAKDEVHRRTAEYCHSAGLDLTWFRIFYVFGPGQRAGSLIPSVIDRIVAGSEPEVRDPRATHDFIDASDVAAAFVCALDSTGAYEVLDLGSGRLTTVREVVDVVLSVLGRPRTGEVVISSLDGLRADIGRTEDVLGWSPVIDLEDGIRAMIKESDLGVERLEQIGREWRGT